MAILDRIRRRPIRDNFSAGAFIDEQSFRLAQTSVQDYCRQRAGNGADALLADARFGPVLDKARWEAYPRVLAMVGAVVEASVRRYAGENSRAVLAGLSAMMLEHFDRRPPPSAIADADWRAARAGLERSLGDLAEQEPKSVEAIADDHVPFYVVIMPLHPKLGPDDFPALRKQLKTLLLEVQEGFEQQANLLALAGELATRLIPLDLPAGEASEGPSGEASEAPSVEAGDAPSAPQ
jgi:hypothetical protein